MEERSYDGLSAIASDSSYAEKLRPKMVEDTDGEQPDEEDQIDNLTDNKKPSRRVRRSRPNKDKEFMN